MMSSLYAVSTNKADLLLSKKEIFYLWAMDNYQNIVWKRAIT